MGFDPAHSLAALVPSLVLVFLVACTCVRSLLQSCADQQRRALLRDEQDCDCSSSQLVASHLGHHPQQRALLLDLRALRQA